MQKAMQADAAVFRCVSNSAAYEIRLDSNLFLRTQETLDEGVQKVRSIYDNYSKIGIKDRSLIWNS
jgi:succinate dehydrogenase (ubiquinone) flavoprotein subunit